MINFNWKTLFWILFEILFIVFLIFFAVGMFKTMPITLGIVLFTICGFIFGIAIPIYFMIRIFKEERRNKNV